MVRIHAPAGIISSRILEQAHHVTAVARYEPRVLPRCIEHHFGTFFDARDECFRTVVFVADAVKERAGQFASSGKFSEYGDPFGASERVVFDIIADINRFEPEFVQFVGYGVFTGEPVQENDVGFQCDELFKVQAVVESRFGDFTPGDAVAHFVRPDIAGARNRANRAVCTERFEKRYIRGRHADDAPYWNVNRFSGETFRGFFIVAREEYPLRNAVSSLPRIDDS